MHSAISRNLLNILLVFSSKSFSIAKCTERNVLDVRTDDKTYFMSKQRKKNIRKSHYVLQFLLCRNHDNENKMENLFTKQKKFVVGEPQWQPDQTERSMYLMPL